MDITAYRDEIKLRLTGSVLDTELSDDTIDRIINASLREIQRYICSTKVITIPFKRCIDLTEYKVNSVSRVMRTQGYATDNAELSLTDPMYTTSHCTAPVSGSVLKGCTLTADDLPELTYENYDFEGWYD